ncbi:hypothetical protein [Herbidospora mongoliensis]|uniref:hypothetical protein n=1 Tax=Herbidospora mongoliensis TaxID=688067 RepID=UPI00082D79CC|nr:hypothetical protein [Herbidospora mongoliensis]
MPQGRPLDPTVEQAILASIDAGLARNAVAREHKVSPSTVGKVAEKHGRTFDRAKTKKATEAAVADSKAARAVEATQTLTVAKWLREKISTATTGRDAQGWATAYGILIDKHAMLDRFDHDGGVEHGKSMLGELSTALRAIAEQLPPDDDA